MPRSELKPLSPAQQKAVLVTYMLLKVRLEDWHGVADVANDIRELEARYPTLKASHQPG